MAADGTLDSAGAFAALVDLVQDLEGMQGTVYQGIPESFATAIAAYVVALGMDVRQQATGGYFQMTMEFEVGFGYRVGSAEARAEARVMEFRDKFIRALMHDRTLGGAVKTVDLVPGLNVPDYRAWAGAEVRLYPIPVRVVQAETLT